MYLKVFECASLVVGILEGVRPASGKFLAPIYLLNVLGDGR